MIAERKNTRWKRFGYVLGCTGLLVLGACGSDGAPEPVTETASDSAPANVEPVTLSDPTVTSNCSTIEFTPQLEIDLAAFETKPSGLCVRDLDEGTGEPAAPGDLVTVHYTGWLPDGIQFDSSRGSDPFQFVLGAGQVISGWDEGVAGMRPGGRRQLIIPGDLGYGAAGSGMIPPNSTLVFEVEFISAQ